MKNLSFRVAALTAVVALAACDESTSEPDAALETINDDVAMIAADIALEDLDVMNSLLPVGIARAPVAAAVMDYSRHREVLFFDAEGAEQDGYDPLLTASINTILEIEGEASRGDMSWSLDRSRDMWVTGLEGEETERTWNGTGSEDRSRARVLEGGAERSYEFEGDLLVEDVVRGVPRSENPWPLSGTITRDVEIEIENGPRGDESISRIVVVTFNGTQFVTMTVNDVEYEVDLAERGRDRVRRRGGDNGST